MILVYDILIFILTFVFLNCLNSPLSNIHNAQNEKVNFAFVSQIGPRSATISWECSTSLPGSILYGKSGFESVVTSLENSKIHSMTLPNLESNTDYLAFVFVLRTLKIYKVFLFLLKPGSAIFQTEPVAFGLWVVSVRILFQSKKLIFLIP